MVVKSLNLFKITTQEYKKLPAKSFSLKYANVSTKFGHCLLALSNENKLCYCAFLNSTEITTNDLNELKKAWPNIALIEDTEHVLEEIDLKLFDDQKNKDVISLDVLLKGTTFETTVWEELVKLKEGSTVSYEAVAKAIGKPKAIRAVANAISKNSIGYFIPCHRVIAKNGSIHKYRWGVEKKKELLKAEKAIE